MGQGLLAEEVGPEGMEGGSVEDRDGVVDGVGDTDGEEAVAVEGVDEVEGVAPEEFVVGVPAVDRIMHEGVAVFCAHGGHRHVLDVTAPSAQGQQKQNYERQFAHRYDRWVTEW